MANFPLLLTSLVFVSVAHAAIAQTPENFGYPELQVTPKASERLAREVKEEPSRSWTTHIPIQASALVTMYAASVAAQDKDKDSKKSSSDAKNASQAAFLIGGGWLGATVGLSAFYRPYRSCEGKLSKPTSKGQTAQLAREREAEECLAAPAGLASRLTALATLSNFAAGAYIASSASEDYTKVVGAIAALAAFSPYIFSYHWSEVYGYHEDYKRRIYGPLTAIEVGPTVADNAKLALGLSLRW